MKDLRNPLLKRHETLLLCALTTGSVESVTRQLCTSLYLELTFEPLIQQ